MDQSSIFESLCKLEEKLKSIDSASEMVSKNTKSYEDIKDKVESFCINLSYITTDIKNITNNLREISTGIEKNIESHKQHTLDELTKKLNKISQRNADIQVEIYNNLDNNINSFMENAKAENSFLISEIEKNLNEHMEQFKNNSNDLANYVNEKISNHVDSIQDKIKIILKTSKLLSDNFIDNQKLINNKLEELEKIYNDIKILKDQILQTDIVEIKKAIKEQEQIIQNISRKISSQAKISSITTLLILLSIFGIFYILKF